MSGGGSSSSLSFSLRKRVNGLSYKILHEIPILVIPATYASRSLLLYRDSAARARTTKNVFYIEPYYSTVRLSVSLSLYYDSCSAIIIQVGSNRRQGRDLLIVDSSDLAFILLGLIGQGEVSILEFHS